MPNIFDEVAGEQQQQAQPQSQNIFDQVAAEKPQAQAPAAPAAAPSWQDRMTQEVQQNAPPVEQHRDASGNLYIGGRRADAYQQTPQESQRAIENIRGLEQDHPGLASGGMPDVEAYGNALAMGAGEVLPGAAAAVKNPLVKKALLLGSTAVNAYFTWQMGQGAGQTAKEGLDAYNQGDYAKMAAKIGHAGVLGLLTVLGIHGLAKTAVIAEPLSQYNTRQASQPLSEQPGGVAAEPEVQQGTAGPAKPATATPATPASAPAPPEAAAPIDPLKRQKGEKFSAWQARVNAAGPAAPPAPAPVPPAAPVPLSSTLPTPEQADQATTANAQTIVNGPQPPAAPASIQQETPNATTVVQPGQAPGSQTQIDQESSPAVGPTQSLEPGAAEPAATGEIASTPEPAQPPADEVAPAEKPTPEKKPAPKVIAADSGKVADKAKTEAKEPQSGPQEKKTETGPVYGKPVNVAVPGEETNYPARYAIRELSDLQPSHNGITFERNPRYEYQNDRDYKNNPEISSLVADRSGPKFDPNYPATESPTAENGGPVIDPRGNVLGGNSRSMTLARVYKSNPEGVKAYQAALRDRAAVYGLKPEDLDRFKQPVMVRELSEQPNEAAAQRAITDFNKKSAGALATAERAVADGRLMSRQTIGLISAKLENVGEDSTLAQAMQGENGAQIVDSLIKDGVVSQQERGALIDERDLLTGEAKDRIAKMLVGRMFESPAQYQATPPELRNKLERVAPQVLRLEGRHGWNITPAVQEALGLLADVRSHGGKSLDDFLKQPDLQGEERDFSPEAVGIARTLGRGPVKVARAFRQFANDEALSRQGAARTFFEAPSREEAFHAAFSEGAKGALARKSRLQKMRPAELARISYRPTKSGAPGTLYGNSEATNMLSHLAEGASRLLRDPETGNVLVDEDGEIKRDLAAFKDFTGMSMHRLTVERLLAQARWELYNGGWLPWRRDELQRFVFAAKDALESKDRSFIYAEAQPFRDLRRTILEERFHAEQRRNTGIKDHVDVPALMEHPAAETARAALVETGYPDDPDIIAAEIGAKIAAGSWDDLDLAEDEAKSLFYRYAELIVARHGPGVLFKFRSISPILKEVFYEPGKQTPLGEGRSSPRRSPTGHDSRGAEETPPGGRGALGGAYGQGREAPSARNAGEEPGATDQSGHEGQNGVRPRVERDLPQQVSVARTGQVPSESGPALASRRNPDDDSRGVYSHLGDRPERGGPPGQDAGNNRIRSGLSETPAGPESEGLREVGAEADRRGDDSTYFGSGLGALEPFFREAKKEGDRLRLERSAALAAAKVARSTPSEQHAGEKARAWYTAERDLWALRVNQAIDILDRTKAKKVQEREAVGIMREFRHSPRELQQFVDGTHPFLQDEVDGGSAEGVKNLKVLLPRMQEALAMMARPLTESENVADRLYTNIADKTLKEGQKGGWMGSRWLPDQYVPHILNAKGEGGVARAPSKKGRAMGNIGKYFGFAERRDDRYPTIVHAVADGLIPKTLDPSAAFIIHGENFARARATRLFEKYLADWGLGHWGTQKSAPEGWKPLGSHADEFRRLVPYLRESAPSAIEPGKTYSPRELYTNLIGDQLQIVPDVAEQRLYVPEFIQSALSSITDPDYTPTHPKFSYIRRAQAGLKRAILGFSGFHLVTENFMAATDVGPGGMWRAFATSRESAGFLSDERDLVASGGTTAIEGKVMDAYGSLKPGTIPTRAEVVRAYIPGTNRALRVADYITRLTFENFQRRFKVTSFALHRDAWINDNPNASSDELNEAKKGIASFVNGVYGGLHWENMGTAHASLELGRMIFLAPDWSGSNIALAKYALADARLSAHEIPLRKKLTGAYSKESTQARLSRAFFTKQMLGGLLATIGMSIVFTGWQPSKWRPFQVYLGKDKDGKDVYQNIFFRGLAGDSVSLGTKMIKHGEEGYDEGGAGGWLVGLGIGAGVFVGSKAAPLAKFAKHFISGLNDFGGKETPAGLASDLLPIPIPLRQLYDNRAGDNGQDIEWSERMLSLFGQPAQHVAPSGHHPTHHKTTHKKAAHTGWEKILLGK